MTDMIIDDPSIDMKPTHSFNGPTNRQERRHPHPWISKYKINRFPNSFYAMAKLIRKRRKAKWY